MRKNGRRPFVYPGRRTEPGGKGAPTRHPPAPDRSGHRAGTPLLSCISPVRLEYVSQHECRNSDDECTCNDFENAHTHLLAAMRCQGGSSPFKRKSHTRRGTFRGTIQALKRLIKLIFTLDV
jgi:hypothetical protein